MWDKPGNDFIGLAAAGTPHPAKRKHNSRALKAISRSAANFALTHGMELVARLSALGTGIKLCAHDTGKQDISTFRTGHTQLIRYGRMDFAGRPSIVFQIVLRFLEQFFRKHAGPLFLGHPLTFGRPAQHNLITDLSWP